MPTTPIPDTEVADVPGGPDEGRGGDLLSNVLFALLLLGSLGLLAWGIILATQGQTWIVLSAGAIAFVVVVRAVVRELSARARVPSSAAAAQPRRRASIRPAVELKQFACKSPLQYRRRRPCWHAIKNPPK